MIENLNRGVQKALRYIGRDLNAIMAAQVVRKAIQQVTVTNLADEFLVKKASQNNAETLRMGWEGAGRAWNDREPLQRRVRPTLCLNSN